MALVHVPEKVWQKIMVQELTQRGYRVSLADRAVEAIDMAVMLKPQLMVTSMELDRMNGIELASVLSVIKVTQDTQVLILGFPFSGGLGSSGEAGIGFLSFPRDLNIGMACRPGSAISVQRFALDKFLIF